MLQHPEITEVAIVGVPDSTWGEVGIAVCVQSEHDKVSEPAMKRWLQDKITSYKMPKRIFFWKMLPKSSYGKVAKKDIKKRLYKGHFLKSESNG